MKFEVYICLIELELTNNMDKDLEKALQESSAFAFKSNEMELKLALSSSLNCDLRRQVQLQEKNRQELDQRNQELEQRIQELRHDNTRLRQDIDGLRRDNAWLRQKQP